LHQGWHIAKSPTHPDRDEIVESFSAALAKKILIGQKDPNCVLDEFWSEQYHPMGEWNLGTVTPDESTINQFLSNVFNNAVSSPECCVMAYIYIERMEEISTLYFQEGYNEIFA